jgi:hypothetical protein
MAVILSKGELERAAARPGLDPWATQSGKQVDRTLDASRLERSHSHGRVGRQARIANRWPGGEELMGSTSARVWSMPRTLARTLSSTAATMGGGGGCVGWLLGRQGDRPTTELSPRRRRPGGGGGDNGQRRS